MKKRAVLNTICVVLAVIFITCSGGMFYNVFRACLVLDIEILFDNDFAKSVPMEKTQPFKNEICSDLYSLIDDTEGEYLRSEFIKYSESMKQDIVDEFSNEYLKQRAQFIENYLIFALKNVDYDYLEDYFRTDTHYSVPSKSIRQKVTFDNDAPALIRDVQTIVNGTKGLKFNDYALLVPYEELESRHFEYAKDFEFANNSYTFSIDDFLLLEDDISNEVSERFDYFTANLYESYDYYYNQYHYIGKSSFKYYVKNLKTGKVETDLENENFRELKQKSIFYAFEKGEQTSSKNLDYLLDGQNFSTEDFICYVAIDVKNAKTPDFYTVYDAYYTNLQQSGIGDDILFGFVFLALGLILSIIVFVRVKRKRIFIDKLFTDIHLCLTALGIFGILLGVITVLDNNNYLIFGDKAQYFVAFSCGLGFALALEFICSLIRVCKSEKKLLDNCSIFVILKFIFKLVAKTINKIKTVLSYKPAKIHKTIILSIALALLFDAVLGAFLVGFCVGGIPLFAILTILVLVVFNGFLAYKWIKYLIILDKIITSAVNRKNLEAELEKLPQSLKVLQESMKYTNNELKLAVEKAVKDERLKTELITNVSHDLKTPLTSIINYVDLLENCDIKDKKAKEYIKVLDEKGLKLKRLIDDLIEASKVSSGNITLNLSHINLSELVVQAVSELEEEFDKAKLEIKCKLSESQPMIFADGNKTFRIVENLLSNAKKYSAKGTRVYVSVYEENGRGVFEIKNVSATPLDISPDELTERFVRGDKSRTNEGNGLGLSIAKELCQAMGGRLEIIIDGDLFKAKVILPQ